MRSPKPWRDVTRRREFIYAVADLLAKLLNGELPKYERKWEEKYVDEIRTSSARDYPVRWICPCDDTPSQSLSQLCPFSNLLGGLGQSNLCMPRCGRITPVWPLSFGAILPHFQWCVHAVVSAQGAPRHAAASGSLCPVWLIVIWALVMLLMGVFAHPDAATGPADPQQYVMVI
jgi:hypothetical protein